MKRRRYSFHGGGLVDRAPTFAAVGPAPKTFPVPVYLDHKPYCLPASNQGQIPACAGYATAGAAEVWEWQVHDVCKQVDGVAIWRQAHKAEGVTDDTVGTTLDMAASAAESLGVLPPCRIVRLDSLLDVQHALHRHVVCICGFNITDEWNMTDIETGQIAKRENAGKLGGHAVLVCGYNTIHKTLDWQNSWGEEWGCNGFGRMTFDQFNRQFMYGIALELP